MDGNGEGDSSSMNMDMQMKMYFHAGHRETVLFDFWKISSQPGLIVSCVIVFSLGVLYEAIKWYRVFLDQQSADMERLNSETPHRATLSPSQQGNERSPLAIVTIRPNRGKMLTEQLANTSLYCVQLTVGYLLMLIVMTYNVWLGVAVVLGCVVGHFSFAAVGVFCSSTRHSTLDEMNHGDCCG